MTPEGKVRVLVRSKKVPLRTFEVRRPVYSSSGVLLGSQTDHGVLYATSLDDSHAKAIEEGRKLSCNLGLELEVVDRSGLNPFRRVFSALSGGYRGPSVVLTAAPAEANPARPSSALV